MTFQALPMLDKKPMNDHRFIEDDRLVFSHLFNWIVRLSTLSRSAGCMASSLPLWPGASWPGGLRPGAFHLICTAKVSSPIWPGAKGSHFIYGSWTGSAQVSSSNGHAEVGTLGGFRTCVPASFSLHPLPNLFLQQGNQAGG